MAAFGTRRVFPLVKAMNLVTRRSWPDVALARPTRQGACSSHCPCMDGFSLAHPMVRR